LDTTIRDRRIHPGIFLGAACGDSENQQAADAEAETDKLDGAGQNAPEIA